MLVAIILLATSPSDDLLQEGHTISETIHPAVFVGLENGKVQVVAISNHFMTISVPPHLRGDVDEYFPRPAESNGTTKDFLTRERILACSIFCR